MDGSCNCGAIKVHVEDPDLFNGRHGHICYCLNCQKTSGSILAANLITPISSVTMTGADNMTCYTDPRTTSGSPVKRFFCKTCGNPIKSETAKATESGNVILKLGIFCENGIPVPEHESFVKSKQSWVDCQDGTKRWETVLGVTEVK